jgi:hypothetical protein
VRQIDRGSLVTHELAGAWGMHGRCGVTTGRFRVRCRNCGRSVLSGVEAIGVRQADALAAHLERCRPDLTDPKDDRWSADLGALLAQFDVESTG